MSRDRYYQVCLIILAGVAVFSGDTEKATIFAVGGMVIDALRKKKDHD